MKRSLLLAAVLIVAMSSSATAAGFALAEQSVKGLGNAFAGGAASVEDATTVFFNPAGMALLPTGKHVTTGVHVIMPKSEFTGTGQRNAAVPAPLQPITGNDGGQGGQSAIVPNAYFVLNPGTEWSFGLGINTPFGMATEWDDGWVGRYHALKSDLMTININPSVAYKVSDKLSVGAGVSAQYLEAELSSAVDFGTVAAGFGVPGAVPGATDGKMILEADSWSYGFNLGAIYQATDSTRFGVAYRSRVSHEAKGTADFQSVPAALAPTFTDTSANADMDLPDSASISVYHVLNDKLSIMADITWTNWSLFDELVVNFDNSVPTNTTIENWDDNFRYSVGATYLLNEKVTLRGGLAYDETPITDAYRTPRIPGADRIWLALGGGYKINDKLSVEGAYTHIFVDDGDVSLKAGTDNTKSEFLRGDLTGSFENSVDIVSVELSYSF